jgi:hypothetical protein
MRQNATLASELNRFSHSLDRLGLSFSLSKEYENLPENSESVIYIDSIRLMLRRLTN